MGLQPPCVTAGCKKFASQQCILPGLDCRHLEASIGEAREQQTRRCLCVRSQWYKPSPPSLNSVRCSFLPVSKMSVPLPLSYVSSTQWKIVFALVCALCCAYYFVKAVMRPNCPPGPNLAFVIRSAAQSSEQPEVLLRKWAAKFGMLLHPPQPLIHSVR